jgi:hypothetical protein
LRRLASAKVKANLMNSMDINDHEIVIARSLWQKTRRSVGVTKLDPQAKLF